jgi:hypothetical protein
LQDKKGFMIKEKVKWPDPAYVLCILPH